MTARKEAPRICAHDKPEEYRDSILFRCQCGNVWIEGRFFGSVPQEQTAVSILGSFSFEPAKAESR